jgi:putative transposase
LWLSDITEHPTDEGKLYLCAVKDVWSGRIVGYSTDGRMTLELAVNAVMESFFSLLQKNVLNRQRWRTRNHLRAAIVTWIERTYHRRRRQRALGRLTPIEFETLYTAANAASNHSPRVSIRPSAVPVGF